MEPSMFNLQVPLPERDEVFLMNTLSDAQVIVSPDVVTMLEGLAGTAGRFHEALDARAGEVLTELTQHGFVVPSQAAEREELGTYFQAIREDSTELRVTVLTTLQCNFACGYCLQGDHGDHNQQARRMSSATADDVARWIEVRMDEVRPQVLALTFFGGEPLLNLPVLYQLAARLWQSTQRRGVTQRVNVITNGLLLTPQVVDHLQPFGLSGVKITLDGSRETHDRMRPLRGGQGTFDKIIENIRRVAGRCRVAIGGNFDEASVQSYQALLEFLHQQDFASQLSQVVFKPIVRQRSGAQLGGSTAPVLAAGQDGTSESGICMTSIGSGSGSACDTCHFADQQMTFLREETKRHGFPTIDGLHMGPCELHRRHAYAIGPDGTTYACPGFASDPRWATGHVSHPPSDHQQQQASRFESIAPWRHCGDCSFIPVCGGGCAAASHAELGDMDAPTCHKPSFASALIALARDTASAL